MKLCVVRVRGIRNIKPKIRKTLDLLMLHKPNHCVLVEDNEYYKGMLKVVKDYVAYGPIKEETIKKLIEKRGKKGKMFIRDLEDINEIVKKLMKGAKVREFMDPVFTLRPPSKGYKNIKLPYPKGDLGYREEMDSLILRMI